MTSQVLFSSFDPVAVNRIKEKAPRLPIALIVDKPWEKPRIRVEAYATPRSTADHGPE